MMKRTKKITIITSLAIIMLWAIYPNVFFKKEINGNKTIFGNCNLGNSVISPGNSPGKIIVTGDFTMGSSSSYKCELKDLSGAGIGHDQIDVSGSVTLGGALKIVMDGYVPNDNDLFEIIICGSSISGTFGTIYGMPSGWEIDYGVFYPGKVTIYGPTSTLPIALTNFHADRKNSKVMISWQTVSESNSDFFVVEHSDNSKDFIALGKIKAQGISREIHNYTFTHSPAANGVNYYRLKQVDLDGKSVYSQIISIYMKNKEFTIYPNPATSIITFGEKVENLKIFDLKGKEVLRKNTLTSNLNISSIKPGIYILEINQGEYRKQLIIK